MNTLLSISWRNIWRHPARSGVLLAAIMVGLCAGVVTVGTMNGLMRQRVDYLIESELTHAQIHHPEFLAEGHSWHSIPEHDRIISWLDGDPRVESHTSRTLSDGVLQSPVRASGVRIRGIDVESEVRTTTFHENLVEGEYLDTDVRNAVLMGTRLAEEHNLDLGNRIVLTFEDTDGRLASASFNIAGLFKSASADYDELNVLVRSDDFIRLLADRPVYHEIGVMLESEEVAESFVADFNSEFTGAEAQTWRELSPELSMLVELGGVMVFLITMIIMAALAFGILNTMLMALFERMREIGMLLSVGMSRPRVFSMIMLESVILTFTGAAVGIGLAWMSMTYLSRAGVNLEMFAEGMAEIGWDYMVYPLMSAREYVAVVTVVIVITLLASVYPALKAIRINPLEAARDH